MVTAVVFSGNVLSVSEKVIVAKQMTYLNPVVKCSGSALFALMSLPYFAKIDIIALFLPVAQSANVIRMTRTITIGLGKQS